MSARNTQRASVFFLVCMTAVAGLAVAAAPDLRLVDAAARQDTRAVRALIDQGVDVNARRGVGA